MGKIKREPMIFGGVLAFSGQIMTIMPVHGVRAGGKAGNPPGKLKLYLLTASCKNEQNN